MYIRPTEITSFQFIPLLFLANCCFVPLLQLGHVSGFTKRKPGAFSGKARGLQCPQNTDAQEMEGLCGLHIGNLSAAGPFLQKWEAPFTPQDLPACLTPCVPWNNSTSYLRCRPASLNDQLLDCTTNRLYKRILRKNRILSVTASLHS